MLKTEKSQTPSDFFAPFLSTPEKGKIVESDVGVFPPIFQQVINS